MKIQKSTEIETELNNATKRLDELTEMRDGITSNLETLQKGFIDGKTSLDELQTEQSKLTILNESIKALEAKQDELHSAFQKASLSESRKKTLERMKVIADETETAFNEYVSLRAQFNETIRCRISTYNAAIIRKLLSKIRQAITYGHAESIYAKDGKRRYSDRRRTGGNEKRTNHTRYASRQTGAGIEQTESRANGRRLRAGACFSR
jgi:hypothetical protein